VPQGAIGGWRRIPERKLLIRAVISEVMLTIDDQRRVAGLRIIWQGGAVTELSMQMTRKGAHTRTTSEDTISLVRRLAEHYDDNTIAAILSKQRRRTATGLTWTKTRVKELRVSRGIPVCQPPGPGTVSTTGRRCRRGHRPSGRRRARRQQVHHLRWLRDGYITGEQLTPAAPWRIRFDRALRDKIRP
jgi:hypothetical protein